MKIQINEPSLPKSGALLIGVIPERKLLATGEQVDKLSSGALSRALQGGRFTGQKGQMIEVLAPGGTQLSRVLLYGLGKPEEIDPLTLEACGGDAVKRVLLSGDKDLAIACDPVPGGKVSLADAAARLAFGAKLGSYRFDKYRTKLKPEQQPSLTSVNVLVKGAPAARKLHQPLEKLADGVFFARDLVTEPANVLHPESLAKECKKLEKLGVRVEILGEKAMEKLGMHTLLAVGKGSARESQLVVMQYHGAPKSSQPVVFAGKGVCFDTGGISIKPAQGMEEMKWDMGGAAAVIGAMHALAGRQAKVNAIGIVGLVENMPSGEAQRPGDVVTSMSGQTVEVINTDAEGRLVLADVIWYAHTKFKPRFIVDLATLTGAIIISLGSEYAGLFASDDKLADQLFTAGKAEGEKVWRLPLDDAFDKMLESHIADMANVTAERGAGSITAAHFIKRFTNNVPWAHLDIAGTAWTKKDKPTIPKGGTGFGVRLLNRLVADNFEGK
jgi:leucyl aminopeptidase